MQMRHIACVAMLGFSAYAMASDVNVNVGVDVGIQAPAEKEVTVDYFYKSLAPYGNWERDEKYGWVWSPQVVTVEKEWHPYQNDGHWVWTDQGWYWQSDYEWGFIGFHYGRWFLRENRWAWAPDTTWGPAWVTFRESNDNFGWAPLPPEAHFDVSVGVRFDRELPAEHFVFVPSRSFLSVNLTTVVLPRAEIRTVYTSTRPVQQSITVQNNIVVNRGVNVDVVAKATGNKVEAVKLADANVQAGARVSGDRVNNNQLAVYRPKVSDAKPSSEPPAATKDQANAKKEVGKRSDAGNEGAMNRQSTPPDKNKGADAKPADQQKRSDADNKVDHGPINTSADQKKADAAKTDANKADAAKNDAAKPDAMKSDAPKTDANKADAAKNDAAKPDAMKSDAPKADANKAAPAKNDAKPDAMKSDAPKADANKADAAKNDAAKPDAMKSDAPKGDANKAAPAKNDAAAKPDAQKSDAPKGDANKAAPARNDHPAPQQRSERAAPQNSPKPSDGKSPTGADKELERAKK